MPEGTQDASDAGSLDPVRVTLDEEFEPEHHDETDLDENANPIELPSGDYQRPETIGEPVNVEETP